MEIVRIFRIEITSAKGRYITFGTAKNITSHQRYITRTTVRISLDATRQHRRWVTQMDSSDSKPNGCNLIFVQTLPYKR